MAEHFEVMAREPEHPEPRRKLSLRF